MEREDEMCGASEEELLQAYAAVGGEPDGEGCVDADKLIRVIKQEFEMTLDIESLIQEVDADGSGEIEFDEFRTLLGAGEETDDEAETKLK